MSGEDAIARVLVATDFSTAGAAALARAMELPLSRGATVTLLHVLPPGLPEGLHDALRRAGEQRLRAQAEAARAGARDRQVVVVPQLESGPAVERICDEARRQRAELVIVGRTGLGRSRARPLGSTGERVVRACHAPVLVVAGAPAGPYRAPLAGVDGSALTAAVIELAVRVSGQPAGAIDVVHAFAAPGLELLRELDAEPREVDAYVEEFGARARAQIEPRLAGARHAAGLRVRTLPGDAREVLLREAQARGADLIAVGTHGHGRLARLLLGSVAEAIVRDASADVLIVRRG